MNRDYFKATQIILDVIKNVGGKELDSNQTLALGGSLGVLLKKEYDAGWNDGLEQAVKVAELIGKVIK